MKCRTVEPRRTGVNIGGFPSQSVAFRVSPYNAGTDVNRSELAVTEPGSNQFRVPDRISEALAAHDFRTATTLACREAARLLADGSASESLELLDQVSITVTPAESRAWNGRLAASRASALRSVGRLEDALDAVNHALEQLDGLAPEHALTTLCHDRAVLLAELGFAEEAVAGLTSAREAFLGGRDRVGVAATDHNLSFVLHDLGAFDDAIEYLTEARDIFLAIGMDEEAAACDQNLGVVLYDLGRFEEAGRRFAVAHHRFSAAGALRSAGECDVNLATLLTTMGHLEEAARYRERGATAGVPMPLAPGMSGQVDVVEVVEFDHVAGIVGSALA